MGTTARVPRPVSTPASVLVDCGPRLHASISRRLRACGHEVGDALTWLEAEDADLGSVTAVIVSLDPARTRSGLALLVAARRRVPHAKRILIAPRSSRLVAPAILAGLVDRAWLAPIGSRLVGLLESVRPPARYSLPAFARDRARADVRAGGTDPRAPGAHPQRP
jgi:hypothetical protein